MYGQNRAVAYTGYAQIIFFHNKIFLVVLDQMDSINGKRVLFLIFQNYAKMKCMIMQDIMNIYCKSKLASSCLGRKKGFPGA